jgi:transcriptional regulator NrdR family protein
MKCPECGAWTDVKETRSRGTYVYRRRCCANEHCFTTEERVVVKRTKRARAECDAPSKQERND